MKTFIATLALAFSAALGLAPKASAAPISPATSSRPAPGASTSGSAPAATATAAVTASATAVAAAVGYRPGYYRDRSTAGSSSPVFVGYDRFRHPDVRDAVGPAGLPGLDPGDLRRPRLRSGCLGRLRLPLAVSPREPSAGTLTDRSVYVKEIARVELFLLPNPPSQPELPAAPGIARSRGFLFMVVAGSRDGRGRGPDSARDARLGGARGSRNAPGRAGARHAARTPRGIRPLGSPGARAPGASPSRPEARSRGRAGDSRPVRSRLAFDAGRRSGYPVEALTPRRDRVSAVAMRHAPQTTCSKPT